MSFGVILAKAGIQCFQIPLDACLRRHDGVVYLIAGLIIEGVSKIGFWFPAKSAGSATSQGKFVFQSAPQTQRDKHPYFYISRNWNANLTQRLGQKTFLRHLLIVPR
jgi:hypothetical protein